MKKILLEKLLEKCREQTYQKQYEYIMKPWNEGGLGFKEIIDWINEHGNLNIRYQEVNSIDTGADEKPQHHRRNVWKRCTGGYGY